MAGVHDGEWGASARGGAGSGSDGEGRCTEAADSVRWISRSEVSEKPTMKKSDGMRRVFTADNPLSHRTGCEG